MTVDLVGNNTRQKVAALISQVLEENIAAKTKLKKLQKCQDTRKGIKII